MDKDLLLEEINDVSSNRTFQISNDQLKRPSSLTLFSKYNIFIDCYNKACNRVDEKTLLFIPDSKYFNLVEKMFKKSQFTVSYLLFQSLFILSFLIPILNIFLLSYLGIAVYNYFKGLKVYMKNQRRVNDPFKNMKFDPDKCTQLKKNFHFLTISFKSLKSEFNFKQNIDLTHSQKKQGQHSEWMIYNEIFRSYYTDVLRWRNKLIIFLIMATIITLSSDILTFLLII